MVLSKCSICNKNITQKSPGLECGRCHKYVHATTTCTKLSNKQLAALRTSDGLEWSCEGCIKNASKRSSFYLPQDSEDEEEKEEERMVTVESKQLVKDVVKDVTREMRKILKDELEGLTSSVEFMNSQIAELENTVKEQANTIKLLLNKNTELHTKNKNLELRISTMEQQVREFDQKLLGSTLEIADIPETPNENVKNITKEVAKKLNVECQQMISARRIPRRREDQPGLIVVELQCKGNREEWVAIARNTEILVQDIIPEPPSGKARNRIYVRPALTPHTKALLYKAKQSLSGSHKFIWCKEGKIYVKKNEESKNSVIIRSEIDIEAILKLDNSTSKDNLK